MNVHMNQAEREKAEAQIKKRYDSLRDSMTERARRLFAAAEASALGHGGIAVAQL